MADPSEAPDNLKDIWLLLERSPSPTAPRAPQVPTTQKAPETRWGRVAKRVWWVSLDVTSAVAWVYVLCQVFAFDLDPLILRAVAAPSWLLHYKFLFIPILAFAAALAYWRWRALGALLYVIFYPFVIVFWKLPKLIWKKKLYQNLVASIALLNGIALFGRNLRYNMSTKGIGLVATAVILGSHSEYALIVSGLTLCAIFCWSLVRVLSQTFSRSFFVESQRALLDKIAKWYESPAKFDEKVFATDVLTVEQRNSVTLTIQKEIVLNRALYLWAYKLHQYRRSNVAVLFNGLSYLVLFVGGAFMFFLLNLALLEIDPHQYKFESYPSIVAMLLYGLCSIAFTDGGGVTAAGDFAYALRVLAGLFGPTFTLTALVNFGMVFRGSRADAELDETVVELRRRAKKHDAAFRRVLRVTMEEACQRLVALGIGGTLVVVNWIAAAVPPEYLIDEGAEPDGEGK
jgi:hypothetical protein